LGSAIALVSTGFLVWLQLRTEPGPIDGIFRNWGTISGMTVFLWLTRREAFGPLPPVLRRLTALELPLYVFISILGLLTWPPFWNTVDAVGLDRTRIEPVALSVVIALFVLGSTFLFLRGLYRWFAKRYEHHGFALGFGPLYFYFRRRR
jgi:hypothetical protein